MSQKIQPNEKQEKILKKIKNIKIKISRTKELQQLSELNAQINNA